MTTLPHAPPNRAAAAVQDHPDAPPVVALPRGAFQMGATDHDKFASDVERPPHTVTLDRPPAIGRDPVTLAQWTAYADHDATAHRPDCLALVANAPNLPVTGVSHQDAVRYTQWLSALTGAAYELPSEALWEYAARAGGASVFPGGDDLTLAAANYLHDEQGRRIGLGRMTPAGAYPPNAWGLRDMAGNVCEWVADTWHEDYLGAPADGSAWVNPAASPACGRTIRGGSWDYMPRLLRSAWRDWRPGDARLDNVGFRVARRLA